MDADMQHPPSMIPELLRLWREGHEVVYTVRNDRAAGIPLFKRVTSRAFYRMFNFLSGLNIDPGAADFRLLDRTIVDHLNEQQESGLFLRAYVEWLGYRQVAVDYVPAKRLSGSSSYSLKRMFALAGSGITQFSIRPLRIAYTLAGFAFAALIAYGIYAAIVTVKGDAIPGWLSIITLIIVLQGIQFFLMGLVGEYLGRTFMQTKGRPEYIVARRS